MKLRVGISMVGLAAERTTGLERFGVELIRAMRQYCSDRIEVVPIVHEWAAKQLGGDCIVVPNGLPRPVALEMWLPLALRRQKLDWIHGVCYGFPGSVGQSYSLTIQDLIPWESPSTISKGARLYFKPLMTRSLKSSNLKALVTTTRISRRKVIDRFNPVCRVDVIPIGIAGEWFSPRNIEMPTALPDADPAGLRILSVGTLEPRKGIDTISSAAHRLVEEGFPFDWRVVGRAGWGDIDLSTLISSLGRVDDEELRNQYQWADVVVSASRDEGFNLPAAEALASGASLVLSDIPVHRELYGDVAEIFAMDEPQALVESLRRVRNRKTDLIDIRDEAAYDQVMDLLSWPNIAKTYCDLWAQSFGQESN